MKQIPNNHNELILKGIVKSIPKCIDNDSTFEFDLGILRLSGFEDVIKVRTNSVDLITVGNIVAVYGRIITENYYDTEANKRRTHIRALAVEITDGTEIEDKYHNHVSFSGMIANAPALRATPSGINIIDIIVSSVYNSRMNYIPCILWRKQAKYLSHCNKGDKISIEGRFQSREYQKQIGDNEYEIRTAYEISTISFAII